MDIAKTREAFRRCARAGIPFNPLTGEEFKGASLVHLRGVMKAQGLRDPRFVTLDDALARGWHVDQQKPGAGIAPWPDMELKVLVKGNLHEVPLYHAGRVHGLPGLEEMLALGDQEFASLLGAVSQDLAGPPPVMVGEAPQAVATEVEGDDDLTIGPAPLAVSLESAVAELAAPVQAPAPGRSEATPMLSGELAAFAPYFLDGLHNFEGIKLAKEVNALIAAQQLQKDRKAVEILVGSFANARRFGVEVAAVEKLRSDSLWKLNPSEPTSLLDGELVRDKAGAYRPSAGGLAVLKDEGTSLVLKSRSEQAYRAAMELAKSKGWAAIELKGKPKALANAWVEAKLMGLEVVNYKPTDKDRERLAARIAEEAARQERASAQGAAPEPETVEVHPVVDAAVREVAAEAAPGVDHAAPRGHATGDGAGQPSPGQPGAASPGMGVAEVGNPAKAVAAEHAPKEASPEAAIRSLEQVELISHGAAPYEHDKRNRMSYFATVRDGTGSENTIWGVDLLRSFAEAGVDVGDTISLMEKGRQPVTVEGPLPEGGVGPKTAHRVRWETALLSKAPVKGPSVEVVEAGMHIGPIMKIEGGMIGQKAGRDPEKLAWHDATKLTGAVPRVGDWAEILYKDGKGVAVVREKDQSLGVGR